VFPVALALLTSCSGFRGEHTQVFPVALALLTSCSELRGEHTQVFPVALALLNSAQNSEVNIRVSSRFGFVNFLLRIQR
jgi:hypothetical protein